MSEKAYSSSVTIEDRLLESIAPSGGRRGGALEYLFQGILAQLVQEANLMGLKGIRVTNVEHRKLDHMRAREIRLAGEAYKIVGEPEGLEDLPMKEGGWDD